jgi:hypothetical protein
MPQVYEVVVVSVLFDEAVVVIVGPIGWPGIHILKTEAAVFKPPVIAPRYMKVVLASKADAKTFFRDAANIAAAAVLRILVAVALLRLTILIAPSLVFFFLGLISFVRFLPGLVFVLFRLWPLVGLGLRFLLCGRRLFLLLFVLLFCLFFLVGLLSPQRRTSGHRQNYRECRGVKEFHKHLPFVLYVCVPEVWGKDNSAVGLDDDLIELV